MRLHRLLRSLLSSERLTRRRHKHHQPAQQQPRFERQLPIPHRLYQIRWNIRCWYRYLDAIGLSQPYQEQLLPRLPL